MSSDLLDAFRHSAWANRQILDVLRTLTTEQLATNLATGHGPPLVTMKHLIAGESYYVSLIRGSALGWDWDEAREETPDELLVFVDSLAEAWEAFLSAPLDGGRRMLETRTSRVKAGVLAAQALHHANVHREQVSAVLTTLGVTPPDISAWAYGRASGGSEQK
jgi:uncharacterized damage-inducible protein DinB